MKQHALERPASIFPAFLVQAFMFLFLFLALLYDVKELTLFALLVIAMGIGTYLWSKISLHRLKCKIELDRRWLFPGEKLNIKIQVINAKLIPVRFGVDLSMTSINNMAPTGRLTIREAGLFWYDQALFENDLLLDKRGVYDLGPPELRGGDIFGFFSKKKVAPAHFEVVVYPRLVRIHPISIPKRSFYGIPGTMCPVEDPVYVFGTRDYQPGRPARNIHWKASARHHRLQEKLCEPAEQEKILIILDVEQYQTEQAKEELERSLEVIASVVRQFDRCRTAIGFATNAQIYGQKPHMLPISGSPMNLQTILETLARATIVATPDSVTTLLAKAYKFSWGVSCLYFARQFSEQICSAGEFMSSRKIPVQFIFTQKPDVIDAPETLPHKIWHLNDLLLKEVLQ